MTKKCDGKTVKSEKCKIKLSLPNLNIGQERQCSILSISSFHQIFKLKHRTNLHESIHIMSIFLSKKYFALFARHSFSGLQLSYRLSSETQFESLPWSFYSALSQIPRWAIALEDFMLREFKSRSRESVPLWVHTCTTHLWQHSSTVLPLQGGTNLLCHRLLEPSHS